jgi:murein DD-endopeptidase MepM/ murein hydrolase activator NlpD
MRKRWDVIILPNDSGKGFNLSFSARTLKLSLFFVLAVVGAASVYCAIKVHAWERSHADLVTQLNGEIEARGSRLATIESEFKDVLTVEDKLRNIAGLRPRQMAVAEPGEGGKGGPETGEAPPYSFSENLPTYSFSGSRDESSEAFLEAIIATQDGFSEILEAFEKEQDRLSNIPSINPVYSPDAWVSSAYGYRSDPISGGKKFHDGMDVVAPRRTPIIATADGVVKFAGWRAGLGRMVEIKHGYGYSTVFGHNEKLSVKKGDRVKRGDVVALLGSTGRSTGPHLHYEIRRNGKTKNPYKYVID